MAVEPFKAISDPKYYLNEPSFPEAVFMGKGSRLMGIEGEFSAEMHLRLFGGLNPHTGDKLSGIRISEARQGGWDMTFNQSKAVSVTEQVAGDDRIAEVRQKAELKAMKHLETLVKVAVRKKSEIDKSKEHLIKGWKYPERFSGNIVWAVFNHPASRAGDPHSHTHYVVYNIAYDSTEKQWKSASTWNIRKKELEQVSELFHSEMAKGMRKLGYQASWDGKNFEVKGFPKDIHHEFSQRHNAIQEAGKAMEAKIGKQMGGKAKGKLSLYNRPEKEYVPIDVRRRGWLSRLSRSQLDGLSSFVDSAKLRVAMGKWQSGLKRYASKLRNLVHELPERDRDHGIGR